MTRRLPFTLTPLPGESFESWTTAYARRLRVTTSELTRALGLTADPPPAVTTPLTVADATGLTPRTFAAMFHPPLPDLPPRTPDALRTAATAGRTSRFCPTCLAEHPGRFALAWQLRWTFFCLDHGQPLADRCPRCGSTQPVRHPSGRTPPGHCTRHVTAAATTTRCGFDLTEPPHPTCADPAAAHTAQQLIDRSLARLRLPPDATARHEALATLTDLTILAAHIATNDRPRRQRTPVAGDLRADTLLTAYQLLTAPTAGRPDDPLAPLVAHHSAGPRPLAVPESWKSASPSLTTRIAHSRDGFLRPIERLRHATTLPTLHPPTTDPTSGEPDPAVLRAARLPDQLWPVWTIRLLDDDSLEPVTFRPAAIAALLLPHSALRLNQITALVSDQITGGTVAHQLGKLTRGPAGSTTLRILTELALACDTHPIPIDYTRRRHLAATTELIDRATWRSFLGPGELRRGHRRRLDFARSYLYELLTDGNLAIASPPYRIVDPARRPAYHEFVLGMPAPLADDLTSHAHALLLHAGVTDEPLRWAPPAHWVHTHDWPGADLEHTDPAPIHDLLTRQHRSPQQVAETLHMSTEHVRQAVRLHPLPRPLYPTHRAGAILPLHPDTSQQHKPGIHYVDPTWLHEQYVTWKRTLADIADEIGCVYSTLRAFAEKHGIPLRPSGGSHHIHTLTGTHPSQLPEPLRSALTGHQAHLRLERFTMIVRHSNLTRAAEEAGVTPASLSEQLTYLERVCGGTLMRRHHPRRLDSPTELGQALHLQIEAHILHDTTSHP
ncbi:regulatory helix-turn-helix protein, lysR family [Parafrankia irregularis]|uniref:Regulatory helix-turn-helix protein, lysR family n=1 Tax=Parafrankia irregularis TaxID=795642 RepID=A0A0S4QZ85_9ACTN|nr:MULTISPECIES: TniQ family protein [Frankiaceae]KPM50209.1 hypothetical protein ACG83_41605 [Frankia sp. R43]KPM50551.1 hypothetical protein ACG83_38985 [Frankia sp. R43]MBE3200389.1 TniQ family protein [Parafrankia sp. CH37]MBE3204735.1 TniQ family protein [Parafrankia sp. CH37]CUU60860.1 regulatory helix-turn-helix protein, lysR family [Parafrankia irregularis]